MKKPIVVPARSVSNNKLKMRFTAVDTDELKDTEITVEGDLAAFKVGEGDDNHYQITNDKKLWES